MENTYLQTPKQTLYPTIAFEQVVCILGCLDMTSQTPALLFRVDVIYLLLKGSAK
jgi:hypothetical protein